MAKERIIIVSTICAVLQYSLLFKLYKRSPRKMGRVCRTSKMTFVCQDERCLRVVVVRIVVGGGCAYKFSGRCTTEVSGGLNNMLCVRL
jgi:hypothetical protein